LTGLGKKKRQATGVAFDVVQNSNGAYVGQLAGNGLNIDPSGVSDLSMQLSSRDDVPVDPKFSITALAGYNSSSRAFYIVSTNVNSTRSGNKTTITANITETGTYFTAYLDPSWQTATPTPRPTPIQPTRRPPTSPPPSQTNPSQNGSVKLSVQHTALVPMCMAAISWYFM